MRRATLTLRALQNLLGLATVTVAVFVTITLAGVAVSALTGSPWLPGGLVGSAEAQIVTPEGDLTSLATTPIPPGPDLTGVVVDEDAAIRLGKAFFWDMQVGSDGQACASCHFSAGADSRATNQLSPGFIGGNAVFDATASGGGGPNYTLKPEDFPFHDRIDPDDQNSPVKQDTDDVASSQGVFPSNFVSITLGNPTDNCNVVDESVADPANGIFGFNDGGHNVRRVEPRNTPTNIGAHNFETFWDGRADEQFVPDSVNGGVFGERDPNASILQKQSDGSVAEVRLAFDNSSFASQANGPPLSPFEMSCAGRTFPHIAQKLYSLTPLGLQQVHPDDSDLGALSNSPANGLNTAYEDMIKAAFDSSFWDSDKLFDLNKDEIGTGTPVANTSYSLIQMNLPLFWGLAIQLFEEKRLVPDNTPFDRFIDGDSAALTDQEKRGLGLFVGQGRCVNCHATALFTKASTLHLIAEAQEEGLVERMLMGDQARGPALYDNGFYNIAVRPSFEDPLRDGTDPFGGDSLSFTKQYIDLLLGNNVPDPFQIDECTFEIRFDDPAIDLDENGIVQTPSGDAGDLDGDGISDPFPVGFQFDTISCVNEDGTTTDSLRPTLPASADDPVLQEDTIRAFRTAVFGAAKVPTLRNVELTGPYMHNGGIGTLEQVVDFYNRGANFPNENEVDLDPDIQPLGLTNQDKADLVAFLKSLTDERVLLRSAPFDTPSITLPDAYLTTSDDVPGQLDEDKLEIPATGALGGDPLPTFYERIDQQAPRCELTNIGKNSDGKTFIEVTTQDFGGLQKINVRKLVNATLSGHLVIQDYAQGTQAAVIVTATKINQSKRAQVELGVLDLVGNRTVCDPVHTIEVRDQGKPVSHTFTVPQEEHTVMITNGIPGLKNLEIDVNGTKFQVAGLKDGEEVIMDISSALVMGDNSITLTALGKPGASAEVFIWDGSGM